MVRIIFAFMGLLLGCIMESCSVLSYIDGRHDVEIKNIQTSYRIDKNDEVVYQAVAQSHPDWKDRRFRKGSASGGAFTQLSREAEKWYLWGKDIARELDLSFSDVNWRIACEKVIWETQVGDEKTDANDGRVFVELTSYPLSAISYFQSVEKNPNLSKWADLMKKKFHAQAR